MNSTMKTTSKFFIFCLFGSMLFQGCAVYTPPQPVYYPPPPPETRQPSIPELEPIKPPPPKKDNIVAASFSKQAMEQTRQGNHDLAAATLERGLRVAPKDAMLWSQLAEIKLEQRQYQQARSLAAKSNSYAGANTSIVQKNYWIIEEARRRSASQ